MSKFLAAILLGSCVLSDRLPCSGGLSTGEGWGDASGKSKKVSIKQFVKEIPFILENVVKSH